MSAYYSANDYYKKIFGEKVYKLSINGGMTCPNRDGTIGNRGCIFCSEGGSGDFAPGASLSVAKQIDESIKLIGDKYKGHSYIAYFQAFTNTYAPITRLQQLYYDAATDSRIVGISIATRPDCIDDEIIALLSEINQIKPIWVELGLQTVNPDTALYIRRGYNLDIFDRCVQKLQAAGINIIAHMIIGLPGEQPADYMKTAMHIAELGIEGIKLQLLHVLKNTDLAEDYLAGKFDTLSREEYIKTVVDIIEKLPPHMVIHRLTGDGPRKILIAPTWSTDKKNILNMINREFSARNTYQGKEYH